MKVNVCINGTFRYPQYIRHYEAAGVLGAFYYAHRRSTTARTLGLETTAVRNGWPKEYALQAAHRLMPSLLASDLSVRLGDLWQNDVIRHWRDCDTVEAVIGAVADRVLMFAKGRGSRVLGHPVTSHPNTVARLVGQAYADLGLNPARAVLPGLPRRLSEIEASDVLVVDSSFVARSFEQEGVAGHRIVAITPGVDVSRFHPRSPSERSGNLFKVISVGTITPRKAQHVLLKAWRRLRLPRAELTLVGPPGRHAGAVLRGFENMFSHRSRVDNAALRSLLVRASVFVLASVEDGFAQAPLEAMACGVPVIVTRNVGMADLIEDGVNGFVVPPFDTEAIESCIEKLYRDPALAEAMGLAAAATAHRAGSWKRYADRVLDQHRRLAGEVEIVPSEAA